MKIGYARVSTTDQNLDRQLEQLQKADCKKIFQEKISGKNTNRPQLQAMLDFIREDDEVVVISMDRLGRNSRDISNIIEQIKQKGATINILDLPSFEGVKDRNLKNLLTNLVLEIQKYTAEQERKTILERQKQGTVMMEITEKYIKKIETPVALRTQDLAVYYGDKKAFAEGTIEFPQHQIPSDKSYSPSGRSG